MAQKKQTKQNNEVFEAIKFILTVFGWICVIQLVLALIGLALFNPLLWLR